jgi:hypothetical protein
VFYGDNDDDDDDDDDNNKTISVGNTTGYGLDDRIFGIRLPVGAGNFSLRHNAHTGSGAHPASYLMGTRGTSLGVKRSGVKLTSHLHLVPRSKNVWSYIYTPLKRLHGVVLS